MRLIGNVIHLCQNFHLLRSRLRRLRPKVFEAILCLDRLSLSVCSFGPICCSKRPAPPMELLLQVVGRLFVFNFLLFHQKTINVFLLILFLGRRLLLGVFNKVEMIVNTLPAVFIVLGFIKVHRVAVGGLVKHGTILHVLVFRHQYRLFYLF